MKIELRGRRLYHPGRDLSEPTVRKDNGGQLLTLAGVE